jgi:hypothetical protein
MRTRVTFALGSAASAYRGKTVADPPIPASCVKKVRLFMFDLATS